MSGGIDAGRLRHRIKIETRSTTLDDNGGEVETWTEIGNGWWAEIRPKRVAESMFSDDRSAVVTHEIATRYADSLAALTESSRITYRGRTFYVTEVIEVYELQRELRIQATERR